MKKRQLFEAIGMIMLISTVPVISLGAIITLNNELKGLQIICGALCIAVLSLIFMYHKLEVSILKAKRALK